jgi:hypothetical protein
VVVEGVKEIFFFILVTIHFTYEKFILSFVFYDYYSTSAFQKTLAVGIINNIRTVQLKVSMVSHTMELLLCHRYVSGIYVCVCICTLHV